MSVFDNVAYGLRVRKRPEAEVVTRVREALDLVQLGELGARSASKLSRGQAAAGAPPRRLCVPALVLFFRRAAVEPRRQAARRDARGAEGAPAPARHHL